MSFYIEKIIVTGSGKTDSIIELSNGVNIIYGPSNTGKTYIVKCIDYMFGSEREPIDISTGYQYIKIIVRTQCGMLWSSFFVTLVAKKIVLINLCCRPCFIWGSITIITVWTNMIIINVCKFFYLLIECFLCCKLIQICAFILQGIEITLHRCIVVRISCFAHALCHIYRFAEFGKCFGRIL